jgi:hypothetical protein
MQRREAVEDQAPFQAMPKTTPLAAELDPRGEDAPPTVDSDDEAGETGEPAP